jgi:hypothetical protein
LLCFLTTKKCGQNVDTLDAVKITERYCRKGFVDY